MKRYFIALAGLLIAGCHTSEQQSSVTTQTDSVSVSATSWALIPFTKADSVNPVLQPGTGTFMDPIRHQLVAWEAKDVFNPAIVLQNGKVIMLYRAQDSIGKPAGTSRIGLAESADGYHFTRSATPVFYPENDSVKSLEWEGGCEDPRVVQDDKGVY